MSNELSIVRPENVQLIAQSAPQVYEDNKKRSERCLEFGRELLARSKGGEMTDETDMQFASYLEKTRKTIKLMNEQRAPITKMFDQIRAEFTTMENSIDVSKKDSIPAMIQAMRNQYAAHKRELEERRRQEELAKMQRQQALSKYEQDVEADYVAQFNRFTSQCINELAELNSLLTLDNYDEQAVKITNYPADIPSDIFDRLTLSVLIPSLIQRAEASAIRENVQSRLLQKFTEQYQWEVSEYKSTIVDALPSKHRELEKMAQANAEEQARMKQELAAKEAAEAARLEAERKRKAEEEEAAKKMQAQAQSMGDLFNAASVSTPTYQPKTQVKKRIVPLDAEGIINIFSFWWSKDGQYMDVEELTKMFKKQITAVEKYANDKTHPEFISSAHVKYEDEVKAK